MIAIATTQVLRWKNEEIALILTDTEAARIVENTNKSEFAKSILNRFKSQPLTDNQRFWLHKLALQAMPSTEASSTFTTQPVKKKEQVADVLDAVALMMEKASAKLQKPKIRILGEGQQEVKLYPAGSTSKYPGSIQIYSDEWLGSIDKNGSFRPRKECPDWVLPAIKRFAANPVKTAQEYGTLTGRCCFCYKQLSTDVSLSLGYGPVCAQNYGLLK